MAEDDGPPVNHRFTARGALDEEVHLVNAPVDAVAYPSNYTTECGQQVAEIYQDGRPATCPGCAQSAGGAPVSASTSNAELRAGEHVR
jgi:hypothetical protein